MSALLLLTILLVGWFVASIIAERLVGKKWCSVCAAVSATWLVLLGVWMMGWFDHRIVIGILMGESIVGGMYLFSRLAERRGRAEYLIFRFPFLLTATVIVALILGEGAGAGQAVIMVAAVWILAALMFTYRRSPRLRAIFDRLLACCRDW